MSPLDAWRLQGIQVLASLESIARLKFALLSLADILPNVVREQVVQLLLCVNAVPRCIREALVSWDRQHYDVDVVLSWKPGPGVRYERVYDLGMMAAVTLKIFIFLTGLDAQFTVHQGVSDNDIGLSFLQPI